MKERISITVNNQLGQSIIFYDDLVGVRKSALKPNQLRHTKNLAKLDGQFYKGIYYSGGRPMQGKKP